jgi:pimeloyl-ACP methyl ester carboxylesterase
VLSAALTGTPTLVIGAEFDRLVWRPSTLRTAAYHGSEHQVAEGMGHCLPLDIGAEIIAQRVLDWVDGIVS